MFRYLILEILVPILIFTFVRSILRALFGSKRTVVRPDPRGSGPHAQPSVVAGGELKKDPVCGTYVSTNASVTRKVDGQLLHFCSTECRDKFQLS